MAEGRLLERPFHRLGRQIPWVSVALLTAVTVIVGSIAWLMEHGTYDSFAAILVALGLVAISVPMLRRAARLEADPRLARLLWIAFCCKLAAALPRYLVAFGLYDGQADAAAYHNVGARLARQFREGDFVIEIGRKVQGTGFIQILTGTVYTITGATNLGGFFVFSWFGFWGLYLFHHAFVMACPNGDHLRYAKLVFFLPSLLFWPSSTGKEAWMCLGLGVCAYGSSRFLTGSRGGIPVLVVGLVGLGFVRPHVAALVAAALFLGYALRGGPKNRTGLGPFGKTIGLVVLGGVLFVAVGQLESFMGVDAFDRESVELTLDEVSHQTGQDDSGQGSAAVESTRTDRLPTRFPQAFVNVIFRPFPWQATNLQSLLASMEGVFLLGLVLTGGRRLLAAGRALFDTPYVIMAAAYTALFVYAFSSFANFGILTRQRVQVLPFFLVLLSMHPLPRRAAEPPTNVWDIEPSAEVS